MATLNDILGYAESLANQGVGADADGAIRYAVCGPTKFYFYQFLWSCAMGQCD